jgi:hypothetical protein
MSHRNPINPTEDAMFLSPRLSTLSRGRIAARPAVAASQDGMVSNDGAPPGAMADG